MTKTIFKTALITLFSIIFVLALALGGLVLFAPRFVAEKSESLGLENLAVKMYERNYKQDKTIQNLYLLTSKSATYNLDEYVVKYAKELFENQDYQTFIQSIDEANYDENATVLANLKMSNTNNRLKTKYVKSLAKSNFDEAFLYALQDFQVENVLGQNVCFAFIGLANFITDDNAQKFNEQYLDTTASSLISQKFEQIYSLYNTEKATSNNYVNAVRSSKCLDMIQFMLLIEEKTNCEYDTVSLQSMRQTLLAEYKNYIV